MSETWQFAMVSKWMPNGNINEFVKRRPDANPFELVNFPSRSPLPLLLVDHCMVPVAGRSREGLNLSAWSGNGPRGSQRSAFSRASVSPSLTETIKANILIDETGHACLADFGLLAIISDTTSHVSSSASIHGGTFRWMSPELFCPKKFGLEDDRRTKCSDCYALGMVVYEVLSGQAPFSDRGIYDVVVNVSGGERPGRPRGAEGKWFTNAIWRILEQCWMPKPEDRPMIEDVLRCLEGASRFWMPLSPRTAASLPMTSSPTRNTSGPDTEESTEESEGSSLSKPLQTHPPKGEVDDNTYPHLS